MDTYHEFSLAVIGFCRKFTCKTWFGRPHSSDVWIQLLCVRLWTISYNNRQNVSLPKSRSHIAVIFLVHGRMRSHWTNWWSPKVFRTENIPIICRYELFYCTCTVTLILIDWVVLINIWFSIIDLNLFDSSISRTGFTGQYYQPILDREFTYYFSTMHVASRRRCLHLAQGPAVRENPKIVSNVRRDWPIIDYDLIGRWFVLPSTSSDCDSIAWCGVISDLWDWGRDSGRCQRYLSCVQPRRSGAILDTNHDPIESKETQSVLS